MSEQRAGTQRQTETRDGSSATRAAGNGSRADVAAPQRSTAGAQPAPQVQPGNDPANQQATYVPGQQKPVHGAELNPGGPEYAVQPPKGAGDVAPTHGENT